MTKSISVKLIVAATIALGAFLLLQTNRESGHEEPKSSDGEQARHHEVEAGTTKRQPSELLIKATDGDPISERLSDLTPAQIAEAKAASSETSTSVDIEEATLKREAMRAEIVAQYGSTGDGVLTESEFRRHAEERYMNRRDLNGNGRLDGFELRAIARSKEPAQDDSSNEANNHREP